MKNVILLAGKAQNGKTSSAKLMSEYLESKGYKCATTAFARHLKSIMKDFYGWDGVKTEESRTQMQKLGTEKIREGMNMPNFHAIRTCEDIKIIEDDFDFVFVDDLRFPNEISIPKEYFGDKVITVRVIRTDFDNGLTKEQQSHKSETQLDDYDEWDYQFIASDIKGLKEVCDTLCNILLDKTII